MIGWHFVGGTLRDGRPVPKDGVWLKHDGPIELCKTGLHASPTPWDALAYAPGPILCRVECRGDFIRDKDKWCCTKRRVLDRMNATDLLRYFARQQALSVIHLLDKCPSDAVLDFLMTGDEALRDAANAVARAAAWTAASAAARDAARDAAKQEFNDLVYD